MNRDNNGILIRTAITDDASKILDIYLPYIEKTAITFETKDPDLEEFRSRIEHTLVKYPYLVAEKDGQIMGYAYLGAFVGREAYDWSAESTIYLREDARGKGTGRILYQALEDEATAMHIINLNACIGYPDPEDEYLTKNSAQFHEHLGYRLVGRFSKCGYKFGRWYDMIWMEKMLGPHPDRPQKVISYPELKRKRETEGQEN